MTNHREAYPFHNPRNNVSCCKRVITKRKLGLIESIKAWLQGK